MRTRHKTTGRIGYPVDRGEEQLELQLDYTIHPGDPGCYRTRNGDGWPPTADEYEIDAVRCKCVNFADGERVPNEAESKEIADWFLDEVNSDMDLRERVESACSQDAADQWEDAKEAAADAAWERSRGG